MNKKGFTLIELLAVIVILAIILIIAIPRFRGIIKTSRENIFKSDAEIILRKAKEKEVSNPGYDITSINKDNIKDELGIKNANYKSVEITSQGVITITGEGKFDELVVTGTKNNLVVKAAEKEQDSTPAVCFVFDANTKTINGYDDLNSLCPSDVVIPAKINGILVENIGTSAFISIGLTSVILPNSLLTIGMEAFYDNEITTVTIGNNTTIIDDYAFMDNKLINIVIPGSVKTIGEMAFSGNQLTSLNIPNTVNNLGIGVFQENQLTSILIGTGINELPEMAFYENFLTTLVVPNHISIIGDYAFHNNKLISVTIGSGITSIGEGAFEYNLIPQGSAIIKKPSNAGIIMGNYIFAANGPNSDIDIFPVYQP